ncbi:alpha-hydroxy-acid oxidizing enzyme [Psychromonas sp. MB-3u-54]|uniref:alpha-hydroxy acid oxidase n=1 Tax=Psychromonas sp. MB-3u-54 TaxID=2058319 RepID=UPI000C346FE1|nr:alpha-hydroxy acid oxidase [Psychromonas sp. MB-3u-54]PKH04273.1 alpha-hydroxy-acid oxidizing enzyme [Psychromonas sp. MB-3u-54]
MTPHISAARASIPPNLVSVSDYAEVAKQYISHPIYEYIAGGGADQLTLCRNRHALDKIQLLPKMLRDCTKGSSALRFMGESLRHPVILAPVAFHQLVHPQGEMATAQAASSLETTMVVSTLASHKLEDIAQNLDSGKWFQLYFQQSREFTLSLVKRAQAAGYSKIMVTVDASLHGIRNRAQRAGFVLPEGIEAVNLRDRPPLPQKTLAPQQSIIFQGMMTEAPTWQDIAWLQQNTSLDIIIKGIMHPADALKAQQMGIAGIVVSNHGGRALDSIPSAIELLPKIRQALGPDYPIIVDGAIERGTDIYKALALGADTVMVGRPQLYALAVAGALGVAHMLRVLREELEVTMAMMGTPTIDDITQDTLYQSDY